MPRDFWGSRRLAIGILVMKDQIFVYVDDHVFDLKKILLLLGSSSKIR